MPIVELESAPCDGALSFAGMSSPQDTEHAVSGVEVTLKISDELREQIRAEYNARIDPEKINLAVRLMHECPRCRLPLDSARTVLIEFRKLDAGMSHQQTAYALCAPCFDQHSAETARAMEVLQLDRVVTDGRLIKWS